MANRPLKQSLADDPAFLASLSDLDRGLSGGPDADDEGEPAASTGERRTLLDLFPPATPRESTAPPEPWRKTSAPPTIVAVEPRRVVVPSRALPAAAAAAGVTYETFYGLETSPFAANPDLQFLYHSGAHARALQELVTSVSRHDGLVVVTGDSGVGKTILCRALVDHLDRRTIVSWPAAAAASADDFLKTLLMDFGVLSPDDDANGRLAKASHDDLAGALRGFLSSLAVLQTSALLIVDDAHTLPGAVLRELSDVAAAEGPLQIVLVGEPALARLLRSSDLRSLDERADLRVELGPLEEDEVTGYVAHRLAVAGRGARVDFAEAALRKVFTLSGGVPGIVNQICNGAMALGVRTSASRIDAALVEQAAQTLELMPIGAAASWRDRTLIAALMIVMMLAGAAGAGLVFREPLRRVWSQWSGGGYGASLSR